MTADSVTPPVRGLGIADDDLLVFLDETGHEALPTGEPVFGIGGIIVYGADYHSYVEEPWQLLRSKIGLPSNQPLHAATDYADYEMHLNSLAHFFETGQFVRHASMVTSSTTSTFDPFITASCSGMIRNIGRALARVIRNSPVSRIVYVLEHSERLHSTYEKLIGPTGLTLEAPNGNRRTFPHQWAAMRKSTCTPGLEVADFVLHAAYGHVRARMKNANASYRKDFEAVFRSVHRDYVEYMEINNAEATPADGAPGTFRIGLQ